MTGVARLAAPPPAPTEQKALSTAAFIALVLFYPAGLFYYFFIYPGKRKELDRLYSEQKEAYDREYPEWEKSWLCLNCGKKTIYG